MWSANSKVGQDNYIEKYEENNIIKCLSHEVNVSVAFGKWILNNNYGPNVKFGLARGVYTFRNIPKSHPMTILSSSKSTHNQYSGESDKGIIKYINGQKHTFYYGTLTIYITEEFDSLSMYCYNHGFMGGQNALVYSKVCKRTSENPAEALEKICGKHKCHICLTGSPSLSCAQGCGTNRNNWYITGLVENSKFSQDNTGESCYIAKSYESQQECINNLGFHTRLCS